MRYSICLECWTRVDKCWRWCPECGSLELTGPDGGAATVTATWRADDYAVEWEMEGDGLGRSGGQPPVHSTA